MECVSNHWDQSHTWWTRIGLVLTTGVVFPSISKFEFSGIDLAEYLEVLFHLVFVQFIAIVDRQNES